MNQIIPYTSRYPVDNVSITKRVKEVKTLIRMFTLVLAFGLSSELIYSQNCPTSGTHTQTANENTYYPGTQASVAAGATTITLGAAGAGTGFSNTPIAIGDIVLIIQMQGAEIASTNNSSYGSGSAGPGAGFKNTNLYAGRMEYAVAASTVPAAGGTLTLASGTTYAYANSPFGTFGQYTYQIIRVPSFYNIQLTATVTTALWNGSTGGVTAINAVNQLDLNGKTINASGAGFRGGGGRNLSGAAGLNQTDYVTLATVTSNASKAEGLAGTAKYLNNNGALLNTGVEGYPNGSYGRGAPGNAGGGGTDFDPSSNDQNTGGGGGGNGGNGGRGGNGWYLVGTTGGKGGATFSAYASPSRLILGGGGGAGTSNNATGTPGSGFASSGSAGGGLVIISATSIIGTGTVNVSGAAANNTVTSDASGGGGAGGSFLIYANSGHSGITVNANGGNGGSNNPLSVGATQHGPGGGGGGGVIYSNATLNAASSANGGAKGISAGTNATDDFGAGNGIAGVLTQTFPFSQLPPNIQKCQITILPVTLLSFGASNQNKNVLVSWTTTREINTYYYDVERSTDAINFAGIGQVPAIQSNEASHNYAYNDYLNTVNSSVVYYRLKMVDVDGHYSYSKVVAINMAQTDAKLSIYPNPTSDYAVLKLYSENQTVAMMRLMDDAGKQIKYKSINLSKGNNNIVIEQLASLPKGMYIVQVVMNNNLYNEKLIKR